MLHGEGEAQIIAERLLDLHEEADPCVERFSSVAANVFHLLPFRASMSPAAAVVTLVLIHIKLAVDYLVLIRAGVEPCIVPVC